MEVSCKKLIAIKYFFCYVILKLKILIMVALNLFIVCINSNTIPMLISCNETKF